MGVEEITELLEKQLTHLDALLVRAVKAEEDRMLWMATLTGMEKDLASVKGILGKINVQLGEILEVMSEEIEDDEPTRTPCPVCKSEDVILGRTDTIELEGIGRQWYRECKSCGHKEELEGPK